MDNNHLHIGLLDDDVSSLEQLKEFIERKAQEEHICCEIDTFSESRVFLNRYTAAYDLIFLDIEMPGEDGLAVARTVRRSDPDVGIIFVTNMAQYALNGYEVNAIDFIVKPLEYFSFSYKFSKALSFCAKRQGKTFLMQREDEVFRVPLSEIYYFEKDRNYIVYHTRQGEFRRRGSLAEQETEFLKEGFARCSSGCIVNLAYVDKVSQDTVWVAGDPLAVSRSRRKELMDSLISYLRR